jgi:short subunit dehydrogenase-like uncharacterized protein
MRKSSWMLYGANGYTGNLILREAIKRGMKPVLAGRNREALEKLGSTWNLEFRVFDLTDPKVICENITGMKAVLHSAGPFSATSRPMVNACVNEGVHYLDITGEIDVFESILCRDKEAKKHGVVLMPGVGFDVVPSDCLAVELASRMPEANELEIAFQGSTKVSPGTLKTMLEHFPSGSKVRRNGKIKTIRSGSLSKLIPFPNRSSWSAAIPWGDVSTAFHSTGIPNITVYGPMSRPISKVAATLAPLVARPTVKRLLQDLIVKRVKGPSDEDLRHGRVSFWACVRDEGGREISGVLEVPDGYLLTSQAALAALEKVLDGEIGPGAWTPAKALGPRFVTTLPNTKMTIHSPLVV